MNSPSRPPTPATSLATPPFTTPPTARSAGIWSRPSSARAPRAESTENSPNRRIAHAPNEMGDQPLNMRAGKFSDWNSMCQKRNGRPRSIVSSRPERMAPTAAMSYPVRTTGRSSGRPNQSSTAARKRSEEHTSELQSPCNLVCRLLLEKKKKNIIDTQINQSKIAPRHQVTAIDLLLHRRAHQPYQSVSSTERWIVLP